MCKLPERNVSEVDTIFYLKNNIENLEDLVDYIKRNVGFLSETINKLLTENKQLKEENTRLHQIVREILKRENKLKEEIKQLKGSVV